MRCNQNGAANTIMAVAAVVVLAVVSTMVYRIRSAENEAARTTSNSQSPDADANQMETESIAVALPDSKYEGEYTLEDTKYGTMTSVVLTNSKRVITSNALPNHETGDFPNPGNPNAISAQNKTWTYPLTPIYTGNTTDAREPGVAVNGVKFEPGTAERATCTSGQVYNIEAIQEVADLGLDVNNAHVQPNGEYHYHGVSSMLVGIYEDESDLVHVGFAADGHLMYYSKSGAYASSYELGAGNRAGTNCTYRVPGPSGGETLTFGKTKDGSLTHDWEYRQSNGDLDECNGITIDGKYVYIITEAFPYIPRCLKGEFAESAP